jgi:hypothetical protein
MLFKSMGRGFRSRRVPPHCQLIKADMVIMQLCFLPTSQSSSTVHFISICGRLMQSEHSETAEGEMGGDAQQSIVVLLIEAEDEADPPVLKTHQEK